MSWYRMAHAWGRKNPFSQRVADDVARSRRITRSMVFDEWDEKFGRERYTSSRSSSRSSGKPLPPGALEIYLTTCILSGWILMTHFLFFSSESTRLMANYNIVELLMNLAVGGVVIPILFIMAGLIIPIPYIYAIFLATILNFIAPDMSVRSRVLLAALFVVIGLTGVGLYQTQDLHGYVRQTPRAATSNLGFKARKHKESSHKAPKPSPTPPPSPPIAPPPQIKVEEPSAAVAEAQHNLVVCNTNQDSNPGLPLRSRPTWKRRARTILPGYQMMDGVVVEDMGQRSRHWMKVRVASTGDVGWVVTKNTDRSSPDYGKPVVCTR